MVPQDVTERLLVEELRRRGGSIEYDTVFVSAVQYNDYVTATLDHKGEHIELRAKFVVGCDGAHSTVRHLLDLPFEGAQYEAMFLLADIETNEALPSNEMQLCPNELGPLAIFPMSSTRRRIVATIETAQGDTPSLDLVQKMLVQRAPSGIEARALLWSSYFRIHHRQVSQMRVGRMFVAGDAAHIHSPFGAQGMNTGLQDVWNLAWKIDLGARGHGSEELLNSYTTERRPVIKHVIDITDFMTKAMGTPSKFAQALRNTVIPVVSRLAPFQHAFVQTLSELGVAYGGSPIVEGAGKRYFDDSMRGGNGILSRFLLLCGSDAASETTESAKELATSFPHLLEYRAAPAQGLTLVRPDGYIAYSAPSSEGSAALQSVHSLLERQAN
jgi:2-polyprenyl-6-methoxyphenol hydroxylase-like FAD-dependent oxidoreductase